MHQSARTDLSGGVGQLTSLPAPRNAFFMFRRASSSIKPGQTGSDGPRLPGILTPIFVVISRRIDWTRGGYNNVQRISFRD